MVSKHLINERAQSHQSAPSSDCSSGRIFSSREGSDIYVPDPNEMRKARTIVSSEAEITIRPPDTRSVNSCFEFCLGRFTVTCLEDVALGWPNT